MKKNNLVLLATVLSVTAINSGCGQNLNGTFTGMINRTMPNNMMMGVTTMGMNNNMSVEVQSTVTLSHNGNTVTGNENDQYGSITLNGTENNTSSFQINGTMNSTGMMTGMGMTGMGMTGMGMTGMGMTGMGMTGMGMTGMGMTGMGMTGMGMTGMGMTGYGTVGMGSTCTSVTGTATVTGNGPRTLTLNLQGASSMGTCSINGSLTSPN